MDKNWTYSESQVKPFNTKEPVTVKVYSLTETFKVKGYNLLITIDIKNHTDMYSLSGNCQDYFYADITIKHSLREEKRTKFEYPAYSAHLNYALSKRDAYYMIFKQIKLEISYSLMLTKHEENPELFMNWLHDTTHGIDKTANRYIYPTTKRICSVIVSKTFDKFAELTGISQEDNFEIIKTSFRLFPSMKKSHLGEKVGTTLNLMRLKKSLNTKDYEMIVSDLKKYPVLYAREISKNLHKVNSIPQYQAICGAISPLVKRCKYIVPLSTDVIKYLEASKIYPRTRFQWYLYPLLADMKDRLVITKDKSKEERWFVNEFGIEPWEMDKLFKCDIELWHEYKKLNNLKGPYSIKKLVQMLGTVHDGCRIHHLFKENNHGFKVYPVGGSPIRIIKTAVFNHHQERKISIKELECRPNYPRISMPDDFPEWMKAIELKDTKSVLIAGKECGHCIGSYAKDNNCYLVREKDICAQIDRTELKVIQCYDVNDTHTVYSDSLRLRLESSLKKYKEQKEKELYYVK